MDKILVFNSMEFKAAKIIKTEDSIVGKDTERKEVFNFNGIKDFSLFTLKDNEEFDIEENTEELLLKEIANLKIEIMQLKGGNA